MKLVARHVALGVALIVGFALFSAPPALAQQKPGTDECPCTGRPYMDAISSCGCPYLQGLASAHAATTGCPYIDAIARARYAEALAEATEIQSIGCPYLNALYGEVLHSRRQGLAACPVECPYLFMRGLTHPSSPSFMGKPAKTSPPRQGGKEV